VAAILVAAASTDVDAVLLIASLIAVLGLVVAGLGLQWLCLTDETRWTAVGAAAVLVAGAALVASLWFTVPPLVIVGAGLLLVLGVVTLSKSLPRLTENWGWFRSATIFLLGMAVAVAVTVSIAGGAEWPLWMTAVAVLLAAGIAYALVFDGVELVALLLIGLAVTAVIADRMDRAPVDPHPDAQMRIVAIGDSYISGEGADRFFPGTNVVKENECRRASTAYPYLVAKELGMGLDFVACSGAKTGDVDQVGQQPNSPPDVVGGKPQLDSLQPDGREIAAVLVSIGGNDVGFGAIATACIAPGSCAVHRTPLLRRISDLGSKDGDDEPPIERVYKAIKEKVGPDVPVVAIPYPLILNEAGCDESLLSPEEHAFLFEFSEVLNDRARTAAKRAGVHWFEPAIDAFEGARICDGTPAVNMLDVTPQEGRLVDRLLPVNWVHGSAHPNPEGHRRIANKLTERLEDIEAGVRPVNPEPNPLTVFSLTELLEDIEAGVRPVNPEPNPLAVFSLTLPSPVRRVSTRSLEIPSKDVACPVEKLPISGLARNERLGQELRLSGLKPDSLVCYTEPEGDWAFITADADGKAHLETAAPTDGSTDIVIYQRASELWSVKVAEFCELDPNCAHDLPAIETWTGDQIRRTAKDPGVAPIRRRLVRRH
jgi:lysophospholipase L1-like esterase